MLSFKSQKIKNSSRREFIRNVIMAGSFLPIARVFSHLREVEIDAKRLKINVFSKHLQFLGYDEMAEKAAEIGFDGVDLTVRPEGHVKPEHVVEELPRAVEAIQQAGLRIPVMTTRITDPDDSTNQKVLKIASDLGISYYRMGHFHYLKEKSIPASIRHFQKQAEALSELNKKFSIVGCYQNHAGNRLGASIWELWELLKAANHNFLGVQYDIRHAVVEGGLSWKNGFRLIQPMIKTIVIKDFKWEKQGGRWQAVNTPFGEGMVDFQSYFRLLKKYQIHVPVSLHFEYSSLGGAEHGATDLKVEPKIVYKAMKRDLYNVRQMWENA